MEGSLKEKGWGIVISTFEGSVDFLGMSAWLVCVTMKVHLKVGFRATQWKYRNAFLPMLTHRDIIHSSPVNCELNAALEIMRTAP